MYTRRCTRTLENRQRPYYSSQTRYKYRGLRGKKRKKRIAQVSEITRKGWTLQLTISYHAIAKFHSMLMAWHGREWGCLCAMTSAGRASGTYGGRQSHGPRRLSLLPAISCFSGWPTWNLGHRSLLFLHPLPHFLLFSAGRHFDFLNVLP